MPVTRSAPIDTSSIGASISEGQVKRKRDYNTLLQRKRRAKKNNVLPEDVDGIDDVSSNNHLGADVTPYSAPLDTSSSLPVALSFSFEAAKNHLISADPRFSDLFSKMPCRPFEHLDPVDPFRTLISSILGQQISWLAAKAIRHRFIRLFDSSLPEKPPATWRSDFFPIPQQVAAMDIAALRAAGLSGRKAEYIKDTAERFSDGRLSNEKILSADDRSLYEMLIDVRGIGKWTVDMFAIFSLRRPDILPIGDLGVQRGIIRWILSLHSERHPYAVSPHKLPRQLTETRVDGSAAQDVQTTGKDLATASLEPSEASRDVSADVAPFLPAPAPVTPDKRRGKRSSVPRRGDAEEVIDSEIPVPPPAFTPSIDRTLRRPLPSSLQPPRLPNGLSISELQSRLSGKKKIKGAMLTPYEMEQLTETWKPYRSLGVYYMWALSEGSSPQTY